MEGLDPATILAVCALVSVLYGLIQISVLPIRKDISRLDSRIDKLEAGQVETQNRLSKLEAGQVETQSRLSKLEAGQSKLEEKLDKLLSFQEKQQAN